jgi:hypothetical protein
VPGSVPPETVHLVDGSDLNSICRYVKMAITEDLDGDSHQSPIAFPVNFLPFSPHPSAVILRGRVSSTFATF